MVWVPSPAWVVKGVMKALSIIAGLAAFFPSCATNLGSSEPTNAPPAVAEPTQQVDINTADIPTLEAIPEIGTSFANAVVAARPFKSVYDLKPILKISDEKMI